MNASKGTGFGGSNLKKCTKGRTWDRVEDTVCGCLDSNNAKPTKINKQNPDSPFREEGGQGSHGRGLGAQSAGGWPGAAALRRSLCFLIPF